MESHAGTRIGSDRQLQVLIDWVDDSGDVSSAYPIDDGGLKVSVIGGLLNIHLKVSILEQNIQLVPVSSAENTREETGTILVEFLHFSGENRIVILESIAQHEASGFLEV